MNFVVSAESSTTAAEPSDPFAARCRKEVLPLELLTGQISQKQHRQRDLCLVYTPFDNHGGQRGMLSHLRTTGPQSTGFFGAPRRL